MMEGWQIAAYERLQTEIVKSAVDDLRKAIRKSKRLGYVCEEQTNLEKWFMSPWGQLLSGGNGGYIIEKCQQTYRTRSHGNGKNTLADDVEKEIYLDFKKGMARKDVCKKYGITRHKYYRILRRWGV